jgi:predicted transcriptional regulator
MTNSEAENQREQAFEGLIALAKAYAARGESISHEEIKEWINTGRA